MDSSLHGAAARTGDHPVVEAGARLGYVASGVLHLILGWIAIGLAWGTSSGSADQTGALEQLSSSPLGSVLLWVVVAGFALLALWQVAEAVTAGETKETVKSAGKGVGYLVLTGVAARIATRTGGGGSENRTDSLTASVMQHPLGQVAVAAVGAGIIGIGVYHVVKGWSRKFLEDLREQPPRAVVVAGRVGYVAKGAALGVVGALFVFAAVTNDPEEAGGLDAALRSLLELPAGTVLLTAVGAGIAAYGLYSFGRARYARV
ncbi:DUF1206 domain-containing protein [Georgenia sp. H159]|uniref:DUF1206 domain-containing protein n=1 Tax=Georgenia sp. H159 TaxID=3076115 RepID=UPI002D7A3F38|nr:DUF1206 domain-containing protein [Georgenia sp. H159]